jgi:hypothetical protein
MLGFPPAAWEIMEKKARWLFDMEIKPTTGIIWCEYNCDVSYEKNGSAVPLKIILHLIFRHFP